MRETRRTGRRAAALWLALWLGSGCVTVNAGLPAHCTTIEEWRNADLVDEQRIAVHEPTESGRATEAVEYADFVDHLEAACRATNAVRGD